MLRIVYNFEVWVFISVNFVHDLIFLFNSVPDYENQVQKDIQFHPFFVKSISILNNLCQINFNNHFTFIAYLQKNQCNKSKEKNLKRASHVKC